MPGDGIEALRERIGGVHAMAERNERGLTEQGGRVGALEVAVAQINTKLDVLLGSRNSNGRFVTWQAATDMLWKLMVAAAGGIGAWKLFGM